MNTATLLVGSTDSGVSFRFQREGREPIEAVTDPNELPSQYRVAADLLNTIPGTIGRALRQWKLDEPDEGLLAVRCDPELPDSIPWECIPKALALPKLLVVRLTGSGSDQQDDKSAIEPRFLAAGWSGLPRYAIPLIEAELTALSKIIEPSGMPARILSEPSRDEFFSSYHSLQPTMLHLVPPGLRFESGVAELVVTWEDEFKFVPIPELTEKLVNGGASRTDVVVLNTCDGGQSADGPSAIHELSRGLDAATIGWLKQVTDREAHDFVLYFYNRLLEGASIVDALFSYQSIQPDSRPSRPVNPSGSSMPGSFPVLELANPGSLDTLPVVCSPSLETLTRPLFGTPELQVAPDTRRERSSARGAREGAAAPPEPEERRIAVQFELQRFLNPALLKNGRPAIRHLTLDPGNQPLRNVAVVVSCDTGSGTSVVPQTVDLERGQQPLASESMHFPVLYDLIESATERRQVNFTVACSLDGRLLTETTKAVLWMGRWEWLDKPGTWDYIPAFVMPYDEGVLDVIDQADDVLKKIGSPTSSFSGYQRGDPAFVELQVKAVFSCLRDDPFRLSYINPPPVPVYEPGENLASGQRVRTPADVVSRSRGTCHDLSILFASVMEHVGIYPLVVLIAGHTYVGFWKDSDAYRDYWRAVRKEKRRRHDTDGLWAISDISVLRQLFEQGALTFFEATDVTNRNAEFEAALEEGKEKLYSERRFDVAIDVQASRIEIQPL